MHLSFVAPARGRRARAAIGGSAFVRWLRAPAVPRAVIFPLPRATAATHFIIMTQSKSFAQ